MRAAKIVERLVRAVDVNESPHVGSQIEQPARYCEVNMKISVAAADHLFYFSQKRSERFQ
jgi:hypothetical protein